ncbi:MAG: peptide-methionine (S)-S-oxide reductase MsrA [Magnetococcus sp. MYC-9]
MHTESPPAHAVLCTPTDPPVADSLQQAIFGMGCFWGAERLFWQTPGVLGTAVGYAGGLPASPTYQQVCSGETDHCEVVRVVFDPARVSYRQLLKIFWQSHDPTQGMRQGNDRGSQYRSALYTTTPLQQEAALASRATYQAALARAGFGPITTEIRMAPPFYEAEAYHQRYLAKNPNGYCGLAGTRVPFPDT